MSTPTRGALPGAEHTLFRGYAPLVALIALLLSMALLAPTIAPERDVTTAPTHVPGRRRLHAVPGRTGVALQQTSVADERRRSFRIHAQPGGGPK
jgi:hypothetical protein